MLTPEVLTDFALLATLSALVHYCLGAYGLVGAVAVATLVEYGAELLALVLDRVAHYDGYVKSAIATQAAKTVDTIRRRRRTWSHNGNGSMLQDDGDDMDGAVCERESDESDAQREEYGDNEDPRALLEADTVSEHAAEEDERDRFGADLRDGLIGERESRTLAELSRLIVRDVGSSRRQEPLEQRQDESLPGDVDAVAAIPIREDDNVMQMNSRAPIPFENDLFVGHVYFFVRTTPEDPHWAHLFSGRRRMFWIQVQGKFKRPPRGTVYLGGELPAQISPGIFTRSIALVIMGIIQQLVGNVNFSFGDLDNDVVPSIALPLYQSADQLIVTPAGEMPPRLGERDFGESEAARRLRRQTPVGSEQFVVGDTYSFDFHTMYVDLTRWKTANLPGLSEMELSTFFDSLPLRMVAYDVPAAPSERHMQKDKAYLFSFEVEYDRNHQTRRRHERRTRQETHYRHTRQQLLQQPQLTRTESGYSEDTTVSVTGDVLSTEDGSGGGMSSTVVSEASSFDDQSLNFDEALFLHQENSQRLSTLAFTYLCWLEEVDVATGVRRVHYVFSVKRRDDGSEHHLAVVSAYALRGLLIGHRRKKRQLKHRDDNLHALRFHSQSRIGSYSTISSEAFAITQRLVNLVEQTYQRQRQQLESRVSDGLVDPLNGELNNDDDDEDVLFQSALYQCFCQRNQLQTPQSTNATCSPSKLGVNLSKRDREELRVVFEGVVYRYYSDSFLRQEVLFVTHDELLWYRSYSSSAEKNVSCSRVIGVEALSGMPGTTMDDLDENAAFVFQINTFAEEIVLCVGTAHARDTWIRVLQQHCCVQANGDRSMETPEDLVQDQPQLHICCATSKPLQPANRIQLNARTLFPRKQYRFEDPLKIVQDTLTRALRIHEHQGDKSVSIDDIVAFLNTASALRSIDLRFVDRECSHEYKLSFYLNLYHAVLAHAMIAHGFPRGKHKWSHFLRHMCYSVGIVEEQGGVEQHNQVSLSLAEIEHMLLRSRMPHADVPHVNFDFMHGLHGKRVAAALAGVAHPDFRMIFALVMNQPAHKETVVVYEAERVHEQLNTVAQRILGHNEVACDEKDENVVLLPRICEWYRLDFGGGGSPVYCVRKLLGFLDARVQQQVLRALEDDPLATRIKFRAFQYTPKAMLREFKVARDGGDNSTDGLNEVK
ncbi:Pleckstrin homology-like domain, partial [Globisporangium splendens]